MGNHINFNGGPLDGHQRPFPDASLPYFTHRGDNDPPHIHRHIYKFDGERMQFEYMGYVTPRYRPGSDVQPEDDDSANVG
jgi:hypothetical protein